MAKTNEGAGRKIVDKVRVSSKKPSPAPLFSSLASSWLLLITVSTCKSLLFEAKCLLFVTVSDCKTLEFQAKCSAWLMYYEDDGVIDLVRSVLLEGNSMIEIGIGIFNFFFFFLEFLHRMLQNGDWFGFWESTVHLLGLTLMVSVFSQELLLVVNSLIYLEIWNFRIWNLEFWWEFELSASEDSDKSWGDLWFK